jgi:hypothetical protein
MPLTSSGLSQSILNQFKIFNFTGRSVNDIARSVGSSVYNNLTRPNMVTCSLNGTVGPIGSITSTVVVGLVSSAMSSLMQSKAALKGFKGRDVKKLFDAISNGLVIILYQMILSGKAAGIAIGVGIGTFTALNDSLMSKEMSSKMKIKNINGRDMQSLCDCISFGIVNHLRTAVKFQVVASGTIAPVPPTGPLAAVSIPSIYTKIR